MGISFAIPIDVAMQVADQLKAHGRVSRAVIGVSVQELSRDLAALVWPELPQRRALINSVQPGGPADKAGVKSGDIVLQVGGKPVENASDMARLISLAHALAMPLALEIWRNKASHRRRSPNEMSEQTSEAPSARNRQPNAAPADRAERELERAESAQLRALRIFTACALRHGCARVCNLAM